MENFQLYRTNILLGGQMKMDLILNPVGDSLGVTDVHLTPISRYAPYPKYSDESLLNYRHQDNIKKFYKATEGTFFDSCINPDLKHDWILLDNERAGEKVYDFNHDAGPECAQYSVYGKSIEVFCPVWLEHVYGDIAFNVIIESNGKKVANRVVKVGGRFKDYLYEYFQYVGLLSGCDDVLSVDFGEKRAYVSGISLTSGNIVKQDISNLIYNLLYRERPLMETDSMLINYFKNNHLISKQLFNFNLCFNISDLLSEYLTSFMYGNLIGVKVKVMIDGKELEMRDFYSNYDYIPKADTTTYSITDIVSDGKNHDHQYNVLDYLKDYQYVEFTNKNKYIQNIIHWSLLDNNEYIFNIYNGFGGYKIVENDVYQYSHNYGRSPELLSPHYNEYINNIGWCSNYRIGSIDEWNSIINLKDNEKYTILRDNTTDLKKRWVNDIRYADNSYNGLGSDWDHFYCAIFIYDDKIGTDIINDIKSGLFADYIDMRNYADEGVYYVKLKNDGDFIGFLSPSSKLDYLTFAGIKSILNNMKDATPGHPLGFLKNKLDLVEMDNLISIDKSLYLVKSDSPSLISTEIEYYKNDNKDLSYVLRYDGKIKPTFINEGKNNKYYKLVYDEDRYKKLDYTKYIHSGFSPKYHSIGYCAWMSELDMYEKYNSSIPVLIHNINIEFELNHDDDINSYIMEYLEQKYPYTKNPIQYYDVKYSYDYKSPTDINHYIYKVNMILK